MLVLENLSFFFMSLILPVFNVLYQSNWSEQPINEMIARLLNYESSDSWHARVPRLKTKESLQQILSSKTSRSLWNCLNTEFQKKEPKFWNLQLVWRKTCFWKNDRELNNEHQEASETRESLKSRTTCCVVDSLLLEEFIKRFKHFTDIWGTAAGWREGATKRGETKRRRRRRSGALAQLPASRLTHSYLRPFQKQETNSASRVEKRKKKKRSPLHPPCLAVMLPW